MDGNIQKIWIVFACNSNQMGTFRKPSKHSELGNPDLTVNACRDIVKFSKSENPPKIAPL